MESYEIEAYYPTCIYGGEEIVCHALTIPKHKDTLRITFHWADDYIQVLGANMIKPNVFEFPPTEQTIEWYLKYTAKQTVKNSQKQIYITIDALKDNKKMLWAVRMLLIILFFTPVLLQFNSDKTIFSNITLKDGIVYISTSLLLSIILWSNKVTELMKRLFLIKKKIKVEYNGKMFSNKFMCIKASPKELECCVNDNTNSRFPSISSVTINFFEEPPKSFTLLVKKKIQKIFSS